MTIPTTPQLKTYEDLRAENIKLQQKNAELEDQMKRLNQLLVSYEKQKYRPSSESFHNPGQKTLFNEAEASLKAPDKKKKPKPSRRNRRKRIFSNSLPREEKVIDLKEKEKICSCECQMKKIGEDVCEKLEVIPRQVKIIRNIRPKYACPKCKNKVVQAKAQKSIIEKSFATPSLLSHIITAKYVDGLPLYRQEEIWKRSGIELSRATMSHWVIKSAKELQPLVNLIKEHCFGGKVVNLDETTLQVLKENGKKPESKSYAWVAARDDDEPAVYFEYHSTRSGSVAKSLVEDYKGYVMSDGYRGYDSAMKQKSEKHCGCWDHCRREFFKAYESCEKDKDSLAAACLSYISKLYLSEKKFKESPEDKRKRARLLYSKKILDHLWKIIEEHIDTVPITSDIGKAFHYAKNQWHKLTRFLDDGAIPLSNQRAENAIRPFVIGRKNWLFSDTPRGADASMALYTLIETAKVNKIDPFDYISKVLEMVPHCNSLSDYEQLLPWNFKNQ